MKVRKFFIGMIVLTVILGQTPVAGASGNGPDGFRSAVEKRFEKRGLKLEEVCPIDADVVAARVFKDYGAMFIASKDVAPPPKCVFSNEQEVASFQNGLEISTLTINARTVQLQKAAADTLLRAVKAAEKVKLRITPRGASASRRSYEDTHRIWRSRFEPAIKHWVARGRITSKDAEAAAKMETSVQVARVIEWEKESIWFSTGFNRSIFSSVAAPGTSQHLSMLALDVAEFGDKNVRAILNDHGWFQTIIDDTPHFTYLGLDEDELPKRGLIALPRDGFVFWVPNFDR